MLPLQASQAQLKCLEAQSWLCDKSTDSQGRIQDDLSGIQGLTDATLCMEFKI